TLAVATGPVGFPQVFLSSITVSWSNGGGASGATYVVQASTMADFLPVEAASTTKNLFATLIGLNSANATYYFRALPYNTTGQTDFHWAVLGSTVTAIETPTAVYFDEVSSTAITASAYAPGMAFSSMTAGLSGTNIGIGPGPTYQGWHGEGWAAAGALVGREAPGVVALEGKLYSIGGFNGGYMHARRYSAAAVLGGRIYSVGGSDGGPMASLEEFDPEANSWTDKRSMNFARQQLAATAAFGKLFAFGGTGSAQTEEYDPAADTWTVRSPMQSPRGQMGAAFVSGKIYVIGGENGAPVGTNEEFDPVSGAWQTKAVMPSARQGLAVAALGGKVYAIAGASGTVGGKTEVYDPALNAWAERSAALVPRYLTGAAAAGGRLYLVAGNDGGYVGANSRYDPGVASSFTALVPNTEYFFKAKARNSVGVETGESGAFSTYTLAAVPAQHGTPFPEVFLSSVGVQWLANNNPVGPTKYRLHASTASDFNIAASSAVADWDAVLSTYAVGLAGNTTYYFRVQARNALEVQTSYLVVGQAATTPFPPASALSTFSAVFGTTLDLSWGANGNGPGTLYEAVVSTEPLPNALTNVSVTTRPAGALSVTLTPLLSNATYYAAVRAISHSGAPTAFVALGSTVTRVNPPVTAASTFSAVASTSFTTAWGGNGNSVGTRYEAVASTASPLDLADPANIPVSTDPYGAEGADFSGLGANTTYYLFVAAKARTGELTPYVALGSTVTPAAVPASAISTFSAVEASSMTVFWAANANALGTRYLAVVSTQTPLSVGLPGNRTVSTDAWGAPSADMANLSDNTTYYLFVS
ncbi:MAG: hypothetical protein HYV15_07795, partial [Elusimicrobia bacterium]|nr:hypothetical protein [Elusimicrobiota bacterium]